MFSYYAVDKSHRASISKSEVKKIVSRKAINFLADKNYFMLIFKYCEFLINTCIYFAVHQSYRCSISKDEVKNVLNRYAVKFIRQGHSILNII